MLGIQDGSDGEKLNTPHRIFIEDANRSGVSSGSGSTDASGRVIVNPSHPFENTTIVAKINFGPRGSALLQGPNPAFSNSNSGQSLLKELLCSGPFADCHHSPKNTSICTLYTSSV